MNKNGSFKKKKVYFSQVSNNALRDNALSLKAKGLYGLIQSYLTLEEFTLYKSFLEKKCKEGRKAFESAWKELKESGYLIQERNKDKNGCFYWTYELLDDVNHAPNNYTSKNHTYQKGSDRKGGQYNNTDLNNTDLNNTKEKNTNLQFLNEIAWPAGTIPYIQSYLSIRNTYRDKKHKRIRTKYIDFIIDAINKLIENDVDLDEFEETAKFYLRGLEASNDGDIIYFLEIAQPRFFDITGDRVAMVTYT